MDSQRIPLELKERTLEQDMCKYQLMPYLRDIAKTLDISLEGIEKDIAVEVLSYMIFYKYKEISVIVGLLYARFRNIDKILEVIEYLIAEDDLLDCNDYTVLVTKFKLVPSEAEKLSSMLYPLPLVIPPAPLTKNYETGYHYMPKKCVVLKTKYTHVDVNLDHINRVNSIPLRINTDVINNCANLPKKELKTQKDKQNWNRFVRQQREIVNFYKDAPFYLVHRYDKRGRVYCQGYHISYQGCDYTNACIEFAEGEPIV